ncbi:MAG: TetR/AcrR family transcriptional regulator [Thermomicrobiales bacterium]
MAASPPKLSVWERTSRRIQSEAMRIFLEKGYENSTVEEIAAAAGVSSMTVFRHFSSKEKLVLTAPRFDQSFHRLVAERPATESALDSVFFGITSMFHGVTELDLALSKQRWTVIFSSPTLEPAVATKTGLTINAVEEALWTRGGFSEGSRLPRIAARLALTIMNESLRTWVSSDPPIRLIDSIRTTWEAAGQMPITTAQRV